jgi:hypothetical protein
MSNKPTCVECKGELVCDMSIDFCLNWDEEKGGWQEPIVGDTDESTEYGRDSFVYCSSCGCRLDGSSC